MSSATIAADARSNRTIAAAADASRPGPNERRIPGAFQLLLALYIILTGDFPMLVQALSFGLKGGAGPEFAAAMVTSTTRDLLLLAPVLILASHPLGILHPLLLAVVVWPLLISMPEVIEQYGGWAGVLTGSALETPRFVGLRSQDAATVWTAIAKYNGILILALVSTYAGFWIVKAHKTFTRVSAVFTDTVTLRRVLISLFAFSMASLAVFLFFRGGVSEHLTALGRGRFRELAAAGPVIVLTDLGAMALYLWIAARPGDARSPLFLGCLAIVTMSQFVSNGSRGSALMVPLVAGIVWALRRQRVPWKMALILLPFMFVSIGLLSAVRTASWSGSTAGEAWTETGWTESLQRAQIEIAHRQSNSAHVPVVARGFQVSGGPLLGQTYIAALAAWIPRALWKDKPRGPDSIYTQMFLGESEEGAAIPVSPPAEMYWNFGLFGVAFLSILYGVLLRAAYHFFWRRYPDPFAIVFLVLFVTTFQLSGKNLVRFEQQLALLLICYAAASFFVPKVTHAAGELTSRLSNGRRMQHSDNLISAVR